MSGVLRYRTVVGEGVDLPGKLVQSCAFVGCRLKLDRAVPFSLVVSCLFTDCTFEGLGWLTAAKMNVVRYTGAPITNGNKLVQLIMVGRTRWEMWRLGARCRGRTGTPRGPAF